ncbi:MAG: hypothetical protein CSA36_09040 [Draconibacterium sp.]|nr:MAG: hypothetical protein CSA36_09040 [Draconibacterium sp.]
MIKKIIFFVSISLLISTGLYAQRIMGEAIVGLNMSKIEGDLINNGSLKFQKAGLSMGVGAIVPISDRFSFTIQTLFSQKGAYKKYGPKADTGKPYYKTQLNYLEVPLLFSYHDKGRMVFSTGISYSRLVGAKWKVYGNILTNSINDKFFALDNFDWIIEIRYPIWRSAYVNARYQYGLNSIWTGPDDKLLKNLTQTQNTKQQHSLISLQLIWVFGEQQSERVRKDKDMP